MPHRLYSKERKNSRRFETRAIGRNLRASSAIAGAAHLANCQHALRRVTAARRHGRNRSRTYVHDFTRRQKIRRENCDFGRPGWFSQGPADARRSDGPDNGKYKVMSNEDRMSIKKDCRITTRPFAMAGFLIFAAAAMAFAQQISRRNVNLPSAISESELRAHIKFLSDDRLEGRGTGARGGELAALYVAEQFEAMGLKGAGAKGSFWQPVSLVGVKADPKTGLRVKGQDRSEVFKFADDFVVFTGAQTERVNVNA